MPQNIHYFLTNYPMGNSGSGASQIIATWDIPEDVGKTMAGQRLGIFANGSNCLPRLQGYCRVIITTAYTTEKVTLKQPTGGLIFANGRYSGSFDVNIGSSVDLANAPSDGYIFDHYLVNNEETTAASFVMPNKATTVSGVFKLNGDGTTFNIKCEPDNTSSSIPSGTYLKGFSKVKCTISNAYPVAPKKLKQFKISVAGYGTGTSTNTNTTTSTYTSGILTAAGNVTITFSVTDSNDNVTTQTQTIRVTDYTSPSGNIVFARCDAYMNTNPLGTYIKYQATATCDTSISGNSIQSVRLKIGSLSYKTLTADGQWHLIPSYTLAVTGSATAILSIADKFTTQTSNVSIGSANYSIYLNGNGTAIGFGMATEHQNSVEIAKERTLYVGGMTLKDYIKGVVNGTI